MDLADAVMETIYTASGASAAAESNPFHAAIVHS